ncbi:MAG TPA: NAD(P)-dependent oxidoreductase [Nitrospira sp.]|nr:NAD(P)-dependent oxidoreductase [Nitrospira sp.]
MNVFITGGSGFIGTNLVEHYARLGDRVVNVDIAAPRNEAHSHYWTQLDIRDIKSLQAIAEDFSPNIILHMAARTDLDGLSLADYSANTDGLKAVIEVAGSCKQLQRAIFTSSMLVCALGYLPKDDTDYCPTTRYGESKVLGEQYVRELGGERFPWTIVRPTSLWGPWFSVPYKTFFEAVATRTYLHPRGREIHRSYGFVLNAVHQLSRIASCQDRHAVDRRVLYLADYQPIEISHWARTISRQYGLPPPRKVPVGILKLFARAGDVLKQAGMASNPRLTSFRLNNLLTESVFDLSELKNVAGATPYDMEQGVALTVEWLKQAA